MEIFGVTEDEAQLIIEEIINEERLFDARDPVDEMQSVMFGAEE